MLSYSRSRLRKAFSEIPEDAFFYGLNAANPLATTEIGDTIQLWLEEHIGIRHITFIYL